jgi:hypothetical protein
VRDERAAARNDAHQREDVALANDTALADANQPLEMKVDDPPPGERSAPRSNAIQCSPPFTDL